MVRAGGARFGILPGMKSVVLFEDEGFVDLLPLLFWRSLFELQIGRKVILDRIAQRLGTEENPSNQHKMEHDNTLPW